MKDFPKYCNYCRITKFRNLPSTLTVSSITLSPCFSRQGKFRKRTVDINTCCLNHFRESLLPVAEDSRNLLSTLHRLFLTQALSFRLENSKTYCRH
ncbi:hypothetical protein CEXT_359391 [Caerostris extrusa]|uniref:Uncharacterized protein n=1 Tax=Caerostris extrusa TaxID=172846 RepID=A0AAV4WMQ4_CAEEX|nr:hypothetical protein CEXT_359391 [Caerostris extrusa]